jgi:hypothetical protein
LWLCQYQGKELFNGEQQSARFRTPAGRVIARNRCQAGFAHDTAIRAIKYWDNNRWIYNQTGQDGATFGQDRECIYVRYDNQESQLFCTIKSPEQLGIKGD